MFIALAGGVGGAKLVYGLDRCLPPGQLSVAVNVGDDFRHLGLSISPDLDTVLYALAELDDIERGWGRSGETWNFMAALEGLGEPTWFRLGDSDLALHVARTQRLARGIPLSGVMRQLSDSLGVRSDVWPVSDDSVATFIEADEGIFSFQEYFVGRQCGPKARTIRYQGAESAKPVAAVMAAFESDDLEAIVICPSNPWLSIGPILAIPGYRDAMLAARVPVVAVSPIIGGEAVKGPAAKLMREMGMEPSALAIAKHYSGLITHLVIDTVDEPLRPEMERLGLKVLVTPTLMRVREDRIRLAERLLGWVR